jgi:site-specific recombinase XerD
MNFKMSDLKNSTEPFLSYRKSIGYTRNETAKSNAIDIKLFTDFMDSKGKDTIYGKDIISFQQYLAIDRNNIPSSINRKIFTLRSFQKYLILKEMKNADKLPFQNVLKIRAVRPYRPNFLTEDEMKTLFSAINKNSILGLRDYAIFAIMYLLGLRVGEVNRINIDDIDWYNRLITVTGKCEIKRTLSLSSELKIILENYLAVRNNFLNANKKNALFISKKGNRIAIRTIEDNFIKLIKVTGIKKRSGRVTPHTLRHTCATMLNEKNVKILTIQNILGHSNPNTTINYYLHTTEHVMRDALEKLPLTLFLNEMINSGEIRLSFQVDRYKNSA